MSENKKPNCYECKYLRDNPGDAHKRCHHPAFKQAHDNPLLELLSMFASVGRNNPIQLTHPDIKVIGDPHGIKNGWFNHPLSFDPTWLIKCTGFTKKEVTNK